MREIIQTLKSPRALKAFLAAKLLALGVVWAYLDGDFRLGDRPLVAGTGGAAAPDAKDESAKDAGSLTAPAAEPAKGQPDNGDDQSAVKTRKSFLANLLELPPLDPGAVQREELGRYLEIAERKQRQIEDRLELLKRREGQLKGLEGSIDEKLRLLDEERRYFAQTIQQEKDLKGERLDKLITLYAKMEPKKAAPVMEQLDKDLVVELFKQLPQKQITAILEAMSPTKSVEISEYYGRVRSTREYDMLKEMNSSLRKEFDECKGMPP